MHKALRTPRWDELRRGEHQEIQAAGAVVVVPVGAKGEDFVIGAPKVLFENHHVFYFDAARDGKRFLVAEDPNPGAHSRLDLTVNWFAEVRRKVAQSKAP